MSNDMYYVIGKSFIQSRIAYPMNKFKGKGGGKKSFAG